MGREVAGKRRRGVGEPDGDGPVNQGHKHEVDGLVAGAGVVAAIERELVHQVEAEPRAIHGPAPSEGRCQKAG